MVVERKQVSEGVGCYRYSLNMDTMGGVEGFEKGHREFVRFRVKAALGVCLTQPSSQWP